MNPALRMRETRRRGASCVPSVRRIRRKRQPRSRARSSMMRFELGAAALCMLLLPGVALAQAPPNPPPAPPPPAGAPAASAPTEPGTAAAPTTPASASAATPAPNPAVATEPAPPPARGATGARDRGQRLEVRIPRDRRRLALFTGHSRLRPERAGSPARLQRADAHDHLRGRHPSEPVQLLAHGSADPGRHAEGGAEIDLFGPNAPVATARSRCVLRAPASAYAELNWGNGHRAHGAGSSAR